MKPQGGYVVWQSDICMYDHVYVMDFHLMVDASKLQVHNIVSSNKVISKVSFPRGLDKTSIKL